MSKSPPVYAKFAVLLTACGALAVPAWALDSPASADVALSAPATPDSADAAAELPPLVVASRRLGARSVFDLDRSVYAVGAGRLGELQSESVASAVAQLPGTWGQQTNRGAGSPLLRGLIGPQNLITIEGLRFNNAAFRTGPNQYLATLDLSAIDRIEVQPGPGGVLYGSDAMGGVIALHLPPLPSFSAVGASSSAQVWLQGASVDRTQAVGGQGAWANRWLALEGGGAYRDHGTLRTGEGGTARASDFAQWGWHLRAAAELSDLWQVQAAVLQNAIVSAGRTDDLGKGILRTYGNRDLFSWLEVRRRPSDPASVLRDVRVAAVFHRQSEVGGVARCTLAAGAVASLDACAAAGLGVNRSLPADLPVAITRQDETTDVVDSLGVLATTQLGVAGDRVRIAVGAEGWLDTVDSSARQRKNGNGSDAWLALARGNYSSGSTYSQVGAFAHADGLVYRGELWKVIANGGARGGWVSAQAAAVPAVGDVAFSMPVASATAGVVVQYLERVALFANLSNGLRAPNLQETTVLGNTGDQFEVPNPKLDAERSLAAELGLRWRGNGWLVQLAGYRSAVSGFIDREAVAAADYGRYGIDAADLGCTALGDAKCKSVSRRVNLGTADIVGAELSLRGPALWGARPWAAGSWMQGDTVAGGATQPIRREPPASGSAGVRWASGDGQWYVEPWLRGAAEQDRLNAGDTKDLRICENPAKPGTALPSGQCTGTPAWWTLNLRAGWRWHAGLTALRTLRVDVDAGNVLDARYRVHGSGLDAPGRGVSATLTAAW